jgi:hypothetical protein
MSIFKPRAIPCPHCATRERRLVAHSINADRRPDLRQAILDDRFQRFDCGGCGQRFAVDGPFFYFDLGRRQWLGVYPARWERGWRALEAEVERSHRDAAVECAPRMIREIAPELVVRVVFGLPALRDKLLCFESGIDDVSLEILKLRLMLEGDPLHFTPSDRPTLSRAGEPLRLTTVRERELLELQVERRRLDECADPAWQAARTQLGGGAYVDVGRIMLSGNAAISEGSDRARPAARPPVPPSDR